MKCFYHSADLDGHCSGAIIKYKYPKCELYGINYGHIFPWELIQKNETVFMVDFSLQPFSQMIDLNNYVKLIWIDHHKSAIKNAENEIDFNLKPHVLKTGIGACVLVWKHLFPHKKTPLTIKLLGEYDVWDHSDNRTLPFQYGMRLYDTFPDEQNFWKQLFNNNNIINDIIQTGELILKYEEKQNSIYCKACAFEVELDGFKCIAINKMITNSQLFNSIWDSNIYDIMFTFGFRDGYWTISLYSDKANIDVSIIAKKYGGGGHKGAAGFQCKILPFKLPFKNQ